MLFILIAINLLATCLQALRAGSVTSATRHSFRACKRRKGKKIPKIKGSLYLLPPRQTSPIPDLATHAKKASLTKMLSTRARFSCAAVWRDRTQSLGRRRQTRERGPGIFEKENPPWSSSEGSPNPCEDAQSSKFQRRESKQKEGVFKRTPSASN